MWFGNVDIPAAVVDAHRAGDLVLFVGAGASMDPPAGLPNFTSLAANIADESAFAHTENDLDRPDVLLGRVRDRDVDVHRRVATQIGRSDSQPNRLHRGIMRLAATTMTPRVVTTNYDHHLSTVWPEGAPTLEEFAGPALPVGDDFTPWPTRPRAQAAGGD
jgi:NAD-dependent SIR2 family protein deacetylase